MIDEVSSRCPTSSRFPFPLRSRTQLVPTLPYIGFLIIINKRKASSSILKNLYNIEDLKFYVAVLFWIMAKPENKREEEFRAATC